MFLNTAMCSVIPSANLTLLPLKFSIVVMEVTNVLLGSLFQPEAKKICQASCRKCLAPLIIIYVLNP